MSNHKLKISHFPLRAVFAPVLCRMDYVCPNCRRMRRKDLDADSITLSCSCSSEPLQFRRVAWESANWQLLNKPLADALGVGLHVVAAKRKELGIERGKEGRKPNAKRPRLELSQIDQSKSITENAEALGCSRQRIWQILKQAKV